MKKIFFLMTSIILFVGCIFSLTGCEKNKTDIPVSSDVPSSVIVSSEPVSSEPVSSEPVSNEPVSSVPVSSVPVSSVPVPSETPDDGVSIITFEEHVDAMLKENGTPTNGYLNFLVTDLEGSPISGVKTTYELDFVPNTADSAYVFFRGFDNPIFITDNEGKSSINLVKQDLDNKIGVVSISWDRPFKCTMTTADGESFETDVRERSNRTYCANFGSHSGSGYPDYLGIEMFDNQTITLKIVIEEIAE